MAYSFQAVCHFCVHNFQEHLIKCTKKKRSIHAKTNLVTAAVKVRMLKNNNLFYEYSNSCEKIGQSGNFFCIIGIYT